MLTLSLMSATNLLLMVQKKLDNNLTVSRPMSSSCGSNSSRTKATCQMPCLVYACSR